MGPLFSGWWTVEPDTVPFYYVYGYRGTAAELLNEVSSPLLLQPVHIWLNIKNNATGYANTVINMARTTNLQNLLCIPNPASRA